MKRFYYMAKSLVSVQGISHDLSAAGIGENRLHVLGKDKAEMADAHVHVATPWEETDIMHTGYEGAFWGMIAGMLLGFALVMSSPWGVELGLGTFIAATLFGTSFGAWFGGFLGIAMPNHHLLPYLGRVKQGRYLMMVDTDNEVQESRMQQVMNSHRKEVEPLGKEDHYSPFD